MPRALSKLLLAALLVAGALFVGQRVWQRLREVGAEAKATPGARRPAAVQVAAVERGPIVLRRTFSGALEARSRILVAPKVGGRVERIGVDLGDPVRRDEVVVWLDDDELVQAVAQAQAELEVAQANAAEAESALEIARRELARIVSLQSSGITSESQHDLAKASELAKSARLAVTRAQVTRGESALESARIRLAYTRVSASWSGAEGERVVAERFVDEGETVTPNTPLLAVVELDPIQAAVFVSERDYASLRVGQPVELTSQGVPGERFTGRVERIAPVFRESSRQARVELAVPNADLRLKPGMFVRATIELARVADATIVPEAALTERGGATGVFVLAPDGATVRWCVVRALVREGARVQVEGVAFEGTALEGIGVEEAALEGRVVTLGQELLDDGAAVRVLDDVGSQPGE